MNLFITRHAETKHNKDQRIQGQINTNLSPTGKKQARKLAKKLSNYKIDVIYCSDLKRCKQTIAPFLRQKKIPIHYRKELRERNYGKFEGIPSAEFREWVKKKGFAESYKFKIPGGESFQDVKKRTAKFLKEIERKEKGKNVLVVTHGGAKVALLLNLLKKEDRYYKKYRAHNTGLSIIKMKDNGNHRARLLNSTRHLD